MPIVAIYRLRLTFEPGHPDGGRSLQAILFLRQERDARTDTIAVATCLREHRAVEAVVEVYSLPPLAELETPRSAHFKPSYDKALREGSALVYYAD